MSNEDTFGDIRSRNIRSRFRNGGGFWPAGGEKQTEDKRDWWASPPGLRSTRQLSWPSGPKTRERPSWPCSRTPATATCPPRFGTGHLEHDFSLQGIYLGQTVDIKHGTCIVVHSGVRAKEALEDARERIATCIGASPKEITFTSGGSEADNQAIRSAALLGARRGKRHIISTAFEHHAVLHTLKRLEDEGFEVELLPVGPLGTVTAHPSMRLVSGTPCRA